MSLLISSHQLIDESLLTDFDYWDIKSETIDCLSCVVDQSMFFELEDLSTSTNNEERSEIKRGRRRKYLVERYRFRRRIKPVPRIFKRDIRRDFGVMYINAFNSCDPNFFERFYRKFCTPNCTFKINNHIYSPPYYNDFIVLTTNGLSEQILPYQMITSHFPDLCAYLLENKIVQRTDTTDVEIRCCLKTQGTNPKRYFQQLHEKEEESLTLIPEKTVDFSNISKESHPQKLQEFNQYFNNLKQLILTDQLSLFVNEQGYIYKISGIYFTYQH